MEFGREIAGEQPRGRKISEEIAKVIGTTSGGRRTSSSDKRLLDFAWTFVSLSRGARSDMISRQGASLVRYNAYMRNVAKMGLLSVMG
jgi:hypothetical protein